MPKNDKELAVEIAKAYIEASGQLKKSTGGSMPLIKLETVLAIIEQAYKTLKSLDEDEEDET